MTYLEDLAIAKRAGRAWTCTCGADNPPHYDACHDCQAPSWSCAYCGTVNPTRASHCTECDGATAAESLGDREEGYEMTWEEWTNLQIGPRKVGGRYRVGTHGPEYTVLDIERGPRTSWPSWQISVRWADGRETSHCSRWDSGRDTVISQPEEDRDAGTEVPS